MGITVPPSVNLPSIPSQPGPAERAVSLVLEAEVTMDDETGRLTLIASTDHHMTDLAEVVPARLLRMVAEARAKLDEFERLANEYEAIDTLRTIVAEHHLQLEECDPATLDPELRDHFVAAWDQAEGDGRVIVVPSGQSPIERLAAVAELVRDMDGAA